MVASIYTSNPRGSASFEAYNALKQRRIALPDHIHTFLFPDESAGPKRFWKKALEWIQQAPRGWLRKWTRRDVAEYRQAIDEVLTFVETSLEMNDDNGTNDSLKH
jgi:hypothetical protein